MFGKKANQVDFEIFVIHDAKGYYDRPTFAINQHDLIRQVINMFKDPAQSQNKYLINAEDYTIFRIGTFDKTTGLIQASNLDHIANMIDLRTIAQREQPGPVGIAST